MGLGGLYSASCSGLGESLLHCSSRLHSYLDCIVNSPQFQHSCCIVNTPQFQHSCMVMLTNFSKHGYLDQIYMHGYLDCIVNSPQFQQKLD